jgi:hypothetical protein
MRATILKKLVLDLDCGSIDNLNTALDGASQWERYRLVSDLLAIAKEVQVYLEIAQGAYEEGRDKGMKVEYE